MHARGLGLRGVRTSLAVARRAVWPSVSWYDVGTPMAIISQLNTLPARAPVNASMAALRPTTHDSRSGWVASPFLYDSCIHDSAPVYPGAHHGLLGGAAFVMVVEAADVRDGDDPAVARRLCCARDRRILVQRQVSPPLVVVDEITQQVAAERAFVPDDHVVEALPADGADDPFDERILPGRPRGGEELLGPQASYRVAERLAVDAVPVADEETRSVGPRPHASRSCWAVQMAVGCAVTLSCTIRRRSWDRATNTKSTRKVAVGTVKKSMDAS